MQARVAGARTASGSLLVFLDSHIEATAGWLEPLVRHLDDADHARDVLVPVINSIDHEDFRFVGGQVPPPSLPPSLPSLPSLPAPPAHPPCQHVHFRGACSISPSGGGTTHARRWARGRPSPTSQPPSRCGPLRLTSALLLWAGRAWRAGLQLEPRPDGHRGAACRPGEHRAAPLADHGRRAFRGSPGVVLQDGRLRPRVAGTQGGRREAAGKGGAGRTEG